MATADPDGEARSNDDLAQRRRRYAEGAMRWARQAGLDCARVEAAFASVPREAYLGPPPWRLLDGMTAAPRADTSDPAVLYDDVLVVLDAAKRINNGQPSLHAAWMTGVAPAPGERILQIGIGAGYYTAILAALVGESGRIEAYEIEPRLAAIARRNLAGLPQVAVHAVSAVGRDHPETDLVYVAAAVAAPDAGWIRALREGGRAVMPWAPMPGGGRTLVVRRVPGGYAARLHAPVWFIACEGADTAAAGPRAGMLDHTLDETRSLWFAADRAPDRSATAVFRDPWFSAEGI